MPIRQTVLRTTAAATATTLALGGLLALPAATAAAAPTTAPPPVAVRTTDPAADPALAAFYAQSLDWRTCRGVAQCATLSVPLSYTDLSQGTVGVKVLRIRTAKPAKRIGSLVLNPGGPGASGVDYASYAGFLFSPDLLDGYDIVGFDPRGVGASDPVRCLTDRQTSAWLAADPTPDSRTERRTLRDLAQTMADGCQRRSPRIFDHMDTELAARDLDVLRAAVGDPVLHYFGFSYGTAIGTAYAELFPARAGRLALDGAIDPTLDLVTLSKGQSDGFQRALRRFVRDCVGRRSCPLPDSTRRGLAAIQRLLAGLDQDPLPAAKGRPLVEAAGITAVIGSLYDNASGWPTLRRALRAASAGNGRPLQDIADQFTDRQSNGSYASNSNVAIYAVSCWDYPRPPGVSGTRDLATQWMADAAVPQLAGSLAWSNLPCRFWAGRSAVPPHPVSATGSPPILVVGTTFDPATPVEWARSLADQLSAGVLLEWRGDGHTAYGRGSPCATDAIDEFLLTGRPPADGTVCR